jgi:hypothetical protein
LSQLRPSDRSSRVRLLLQGPQTALHALRKSECSDRTSPPLSLSHCSHDQLTLYLRTSVTQGEGET